MQFTQEEWDAIGITMLPTQSFVDLDDGLEPFVPDEDETSPPRGFKLRNSALAKSLRLSFELVWHNIGRVKPTEGDELQNGELERALANRSAPVEFKEEEWAKFAIGKRSHKIFIKSGDDYFAPLPPNAKTFTNHEWDEFGIPNLRFDDFISVSINGLHCNFQPVVQTGSRKLFCFWPSEDRQSHIYTYSLVAPPDSWRVLRSFADVLTPVFTDDRRPEWSTWYHFILGFEVEMHFKNCWADSKWIHGHIAPSKFCKWMLVPLKAIFLLMIDFVHNFVMCEPVPYYTAPSAVLIRSTSAPQVYAPCRSRAPPRILRRAQLLAQLPPPCTS